MKMEFIEVSGWPKAEDITCLSLDTIESFRKVSLTLGQKKSHYVEIKLISGEIVNTSLSYASLKELVGVKNRCVCPSCGHPVLICTSSIVMRTNGSYEEWTCPNCGNIFYQQIGMEVK